MKTAPRDLDALQTEARPEALADLADRIHGHVVQQLGHVGRQAQRLLLALQHVVQIYAGNLGVVAQRLHFVFEVLDGLFQRRQRYRRFAVGGFGWDLAVDAQRGEVFAVRVKRVGVRGQIGFLVLQARDFGIGFFGGFIAIVCSIWRQFFGVQLNVLVETLKLAPDGNGVAE